MLKAYNYGDVHKSEVKKSMHSLGCVHLDESLGSIYIYS